MFDILSKKRSPDATAALRLRAAARPARLRLPPRRWLVGLVRAPSGLRAHPRGRAPAGPGFGQARRRGGPARQQGARCGALCRGSPAICHRPGPDGRGLHRQPVGLGAARRGAGHRHRQRVLWHQRRPRAGTPQHAAPPQRRAGPAAEHALHALLHRAQPRPPRPGGHRGGPRQRPPRRGALRLLVPLHHRVLAQRLGVGGPPALCPAAAPPQPAQRDDPLRPDSAWRGPSRPVGLWPAGHPVLGRRLGPGHRLSGDGELCRALRAAT